MRDKPNTAHGSQMADISRGVVGIYRDFYGKGPTKAKSQLFGDTIVCEVEDFFTPAERTLVDRGELEIVLSTRTKFQDALRSEFTNLVEQITGRTVRAFLSDTTTEPEIAVEVFVLEPDSSELPA